MSNEVDSQVIQNTQKALEKYVKKLPLTEKLLKKPPFRFLHDLVNNIIKETGFLKGLYTDRELLSENMKEKDDKIGFLTKLITATKTITEKELTVRPNKIIAGLEPTETNLLLQAIGYAIENKLDSTQYVSQLKPEKKSKTSKTKDNEKVAKQVKPKEKTIKGEVKKEKKISPSETKPINTKPSIGKSRDTKAITSKTSKESIKKEKRDTSKVKEKKIKKEESPKFVPQASPAREIVEEQIPEQKVENLIITESDPVVEQNIEEEMIGEEKLKKQKSAKPKSSKNDTEESEISNQNLNIQTTEVVVERPKSVKPKLETIEKKSSEEKLLENTSNDFPTEILTPAKIKDETNFTPARALLEPNNNSNEKVRPRSSLRPPSVRPSSARPGAPRLRNENFIPPGEIVPLGKVNVIIENFSNDLDEEDTVTIQSIPEPEFQEPTVLMPMPTDKGHLVEQILEQIQQDDVVEHTKHTVNIEWEQDGLRSKNVANKEIEQLKVAIQTLTKTANPLGKLINYLHEDIEAMHTELDTWTNLARQTMADVANQKRISDESNKPLQAELEQIEENIIKHQQQINSIYGNILRNEIRIRDLLVK